MRRGAKSRRKEGQAKLHDLKLKGKVGVVWFFALQVRGAGKLAEGKDREKREEDIFARG